jgi:hypothetical protein
MDDDIRIIAKVVSRISADKKKLNPTQLEVLEHPDRLRTTTQVKTAEKLVEMGLLDKTPHDYKPDVFYYRRTADGQKYLKVLEDAKDDLTDENIYEIARKFPNFTDPRVDLDRRCIDLAIRDPAHGNVAVHSVRKVPSDRDIEKIVNDLMSEIKHRALKTQERWKYIPK